MLQNAKVTIFTVSELLRGKQQGAGGEVRNNPPDSGYYSSGIIDFNPKPS